MVAIVMIMLNIFMKEPTLFSQALLLFFLLILSQNGEKDKPLSFGYRMEDEGWQ